MKCKVDGCDRDARYKSDQLCQKHYFRIRRNGSLELVLEKKKREKGYSRVYRITAHGPRPYQRLYEPDHPLADKGGYVSEHRFVVWNRYGNDLPPCEICGKESSWATSHIDHRDNDPRNNHHDNLRPLCSGCNTWRDRSPEHTFKHNHALTFDGKTDTPEGWSRDPRVKVRGRTIILRKMAGMSDYDALFSPKTTHNGLGRIDRRPRKTAAKHERKNSVNIVIAGEVKTSAEWSRDSRCNVSDATLRNRIRAGWVQDLNILRRIKALDNPKTRELKKLIGERE